MIKIIAETAWHHEGDFNFMVQLVDQLIRQDIEYIKIHTTLDFDEYMDASHPAYDTIKKWLFSESQWKQIIEQIISGGKKPFLLLNDQKSVELAHEYNVDIVEVHSVCLNDIHLLKKIKETLSADTKIVLGVGGSTLYEIENAITYIGNPNIVLMHGFQNYPTKYEDINFKKTQKIKQLYPQFEHGYADHCGWDEPNNILITTIGASLGMDYIEKHVTTLYGKERCDWNSAISIEMLQKLIQQLKLVDECDGDGSLSLNGGERQYSETGVMKKAAVFANDVLKNQKLTEKDIVFKRTKDSSDLSQIDVISKFGEPLTSTGKKGDVLNSNYLKK